MLKRVVAALVFVVALMAQTVVTSPVQINYNMAQLGAENNGTFDNSTITQTVLNNGTYPITLYYPGSSGSGCYKFTTNMVAPQGRTVFVYGDGPENTQFLQTSTSKDMWDFNHTNNSTLWTAGGVHDASIKAGSSCYAPGVVPGTIYSSGTAVSIQNGNNAVSLDNVFFAGWAVGLNLDQTWQGMFSRLWGYDLGVGIKVGCNTSYPQGAGNHFSNILFTNNGLDPTDASTAIGFEDCSGGQYLTDDEFDGFFNGFLAQPQSSGQAIEGMSLTHVLADTSIGDGFVFDGTNGVISATNGVNLWGSFNNSSGVRIKGTGSNVTGLALQGQFRENGLYGIDDSAAVNVSIGSGSQITGNGRLNLTLVSAGTGCQAGDYVQLQGGTLAAGNNATVILLQLVNGSGAVTQWQVQSSGYYSTKPSNPASTAADSPNPYHCSSAPTFNIAYANDGAGVHVASGVGITVTGTQCGNFATSSTSQATCLYVESGAGVNTYRGNTTTSLSPGTSFGPVVNQSTARGTWDQTLYAATLSNVTNGTTNYIGPAGSQTNANQAVFNVNPGMSITEMGCTSANTPASGQNYTFTPYMNGSTVGTSGTITNGNFTFFEPEAVPVVGSGGNGSSNVSIQDVVSATAGGSTHSCWLSLAN